MKYIFLCLFSLLCSAQGKAENQTLTNLKAAFTLFYPQNFITISNSGSVQLEGLGADGGVFYTLFTHPNATERPWRSLVHRTKQSSGAFDWIELGRIGEDACYLFPVAVVVSSDGTAQVHKLVNNTCNTNSIGHTLFTPYVSSYIPGVGFSNFDQKPSFYTMPGDSIRGATYGRDGNFVAEPMPALNIPYRMGVWDFYVPGNQTQNSSNNLSVKERNGRKILELRNNQNSNPDPYYTEDIGSSETVTYIIANTDCPNQTFKRYIYTNTSELRCGYDSITALAILGKNGALTVRAVDWSKNAMPVLLRSVNILPPLAKAVEIRDFRVTATGHLEMMIKATYADGRFGYLLQNY